MLMNRVSIFMPDRRFALRAKRFTGRANPVDC
jgi:hypothetical protein